MPKRISANKRLLMAAIALVVSVSAFFWPQKEISVENEADLQALSQLSLPDSDSFTEDQRVSPEEPPAGPEEIAYTIQDNDTLGHIFSRLELPRATMYKLLEADHDFLRLDDLRPGQELLITREGENRLVTRLQLVIDRINTLEFVRDGEEYTGEMLAHETNVVERRIEVVVTSNLYQNAIDFGMTPAEVDVIARLFEDKVTFSKDLRLGDTIQVLFDDLYVGDTATGRSTIKAIVFRNNRRNLAAFLHEDGQYYDQDGRSLHRAFLRYPLAQRYRISSHFNPRRLHPVTGRISPHNGTDFATPVGTEILSISDGVVARAGNHPIAGKYVDIKHTEKYSTRYLHLDKILVRSGKRVSMGDRVALSGQTGRVTGAHLHFELHANGRPVDAMKYPLPEGRQLNESQMIVFRRLVDTYLSAMSSQETDELFG
ncbi:MAG: peptidoglycan DD-metalloendopeptidase family protein [Endozoicomonas sp.]